MGYHPRIESSELTNFCTTRSRNSELWFIKNNKLEESILGYTAKYCERYEVTLYALSVEGNHLHTLVKFPKANRAQRSRSVPV
jgi:REP element-mobilizing transposase RayT